MWHDAFSDRLVPEFRQVTALRRNGDEGLGDWDPSSWKLTVEGLAGDETSKILTLKDVKALPRYEMTTELCCIEGWSIVVRWAGARPRGLYGEVPARHSERKRSRRS